jgi:cullin-associated NEDD8-dissociated protein 1
VSLLALFERSITSNAVEFQELFEKLHQQLMPDLSKTATYHLAECIAAVASATHLENTKTVLDGALNAMKTAVLDETDGAKVKDLQLSVLIAGDVGRKVDTVAVFGAGFADELRTSFVRLLDHSVDELMYAAAYALGNASVKSPSVFLSEIVQRIDSSNKKQKHVVLSALRDFIKCGHKLSATDITSASLPVILPPLEHNCGDSEEGVRTMVADCFGSLACLHPDEVLSKLQSILSAHSEISAFGGKISEKDEISKKNAWVSWTVITSVKQAIAGKVDAVKLAAAMPTFVAALKQEELSLRTTALLMIYASVHHLPQAITSLLDEIVFPELYRVANLKLERKVDLGPFTHTVDDALPLRKAALSIFASCLENAPESMDVSKFLPVLATAMGDAEDIQLHAHQIVISMCARQPSYLVTSIDTFVDPLEKTMNKKPGQKTGTELERLNDWIKSSIRVMIALDALDGVPSSGKFGQFVERAKSDAKFAEKIRTIEEER